MQTLLPLSRRGRLRRALAHPLAVATVTATVCCTLTTTPVAAAAARLVTGADVKDSSLTGKDVRDGSLTSADLAAGVVTAGPQGPAGPPGDAGPQGDVGPQGATGPRGLSSWDAIPSGTTVTGGTILNFSSAPNNATQLWGFDLPGIAPSRLTDGTVNLAPNNGVVDAGNDDADPSCTGSTAAPTAPAGKVCVYIGGQTGQFLYLNATALYADGGNDQRRHFMLLGASRSGKQGYIDLAWAYTAP